MAKKMEYFYDKEPNIYNQEDVYNNIIVPKLNMVKGLCYHYGIPFFCTAAVANENNDTTYANDGVLTGSLRTKLFDDHFVDILKLLNGVPLSPMGSLNIDDEEFFKQLEELDKEVVEEENIELEIAKSTNYDNDDIDLYDNDFDDILDGYGEPDYREEVEDIDDVIEEQKEKNKPVISLMPHVTETDTTPVVEEKKSNITFIAPNCEKKDDFGLDKIIEMKFEKMEVIAI